METGKDRLTIETLVKTALQKDVLRLCESADFVKKIERGPHFIDEVLAANGGIYGVTTGYGDSCTEQVAAAHYYDLPLNLTRYHGCGLGAHFDRETTRAIMIVRLNTLAEGYSGVSMELLRYIAFFIEHDILPLIPQEGSVGASGDLTPLSYLAGALVGERNVLYQNKIRPSSEVLAELGKAPYRFRPKEALAIMNGTAVMNAVAALAFFRARYLADLACRVTAMISRALKGNAGHFAERLFEVKPHPGLMRAAEKIRAALRGCPLDRDGTRIQDQYSLRCAPHVIGVFYDMEETLQRLIETEMNSANDNPIIDPETQTVYHGGHFYGGHICFAMDSLKNIVANIADVLDRQLALLVDTKFNRGLPPNLTGADQTINHGFKAVQIAASAWTAEALKNTMPASVFSRSTECHNQDKVSMGTIAARDCVRVIELSEQTLAACLLAAAQALRLRHYDNDLSELTKTCNEVFSYFKPLDQDRQLEEDLRTTVAFIKTGFFAIT
jgi:histidine ammonia-lyase